MEFTGEGMHTLTMDDRFSIANMAIEAGAKNGIFEVDDLTVEYMKDHSDKEYTVFKADDDAEYVQTIDIDLQQFLIRLHSLTCLKMQEHRKTGAMLKLTRL